MNHCTHRRALFASRIAASLIVAVLASIVPSAAGPAAAAPTVPDTTIGVPLQQTLFLPIAAAAAPQPASGIYIQDTNYPIPAGAVFVSPAGNDNNPGTQAAPWRTIAKAVRSAPEGGTVVIRQGVYHEAVTFGGKPLTLQPFPHEQVWMDGAVDVTGWVPDTTIWRKDNWTPRFQQGGLPAEFIDPAYPFAAYPDMVFVDGQPLRQVGSKESVGPGTFFVNYAAKQLYIGTNPLGRRVQGAALAQALIMNGGTQGSVVRGLGFRHYASHRNDFGMVKSSSPNVTFERNTFAWSAAVGLGVFGPDNVVRENLFTHNGIVGLLASSAHDLVAERNIFVANNQEHFEPTHEAGGAKIADSYHTVFRNNLAEDNFGKGIWWDVNSYDATAVSNTFRRNTHRGLAIEVSRKALVASNLFVDHTEPYAFAMLVNESNDVEVYNNTFHNNLLSIAVTEGNRDGTRTITLRNGQQISFRTDVSEVVLKNNILSYAGPAVRGTFLVSIRDWTERRPARDMVEAMNTNGYYRASSAAPAKAVRWGVANAAPILYSDVAQFHAGTGHEPRALIIDNQAANPFFMDAARGNYRLAPTSPARGRGEPLPPHVAAVIGVPSGVPVDLGVLAWSE